MKYFLPLLLITNSILAQEFSERVERREFTTTIEVEVHKPISFKFDTSMKPTWEQTDRIQPFKTDLNIPLHVSYVKHTDGTYFLWAPPGNYTISGSSTLINWTKQDIDERSFSVTLIVRGDGPTPNPDPDPDPDPTPTPTPQPNNPFPSQTGSKELRVLLVEEQEERDNISREQFAIFSSEEVRNYLNTKAQPGDWRILDRDTNFTGDSIWKKAMSVVPADKNFWVVISDGFKWESVELPKNTNDMMVLLRKYGG